MSPHFTSRLYAQIREAEHAASVLKAERDEARHERDILLRARDLDATDAARAKVYAAGFREGAEAMRARAVECCRAAARVGAGSAGTVVAMEFIAAVVLDQPEKTP